jgi:hypothetical protein
MADAVQALDYVTSAARCLNEDPGERRTMRLHLRARMFRMGYHPPICATDIRSDQSAGRLAALPRLRRGRPAREVHRLLIQEHHHNLRPGSLLAARHDVTKTVPVVLAGDVIATRSTDVWPVDLEVARAHAPLAVDGIGNRRALISNTRVIIPSAPCPQPRASSAQPLPSPLRYPYTQVRLLHAHHRQDHQVRSV